MNLKKIKTYFLDIFIILVIIIIICTASNLAKSINTKTTKYPTKGYGIIIKNPNGMDCNSYTLTSKKDNFNYTLTFINNSGKSNNFMLSIFVDYKQTKFYASNKKLMNIFKFDLNSGEGKNIPIKFNTGIYVKGNHIITFVVSPTSTKSNPIINTHNLVIKNTNLIEKPKLLFNDSSFYKNKSNILLKLNSKSTKIESNPDEIIKLPITFGSFKNTYEYIFLLTLNSNQITINNTLNYLYFNLPEGYATNKDISFTAPHTKGIYALDGFLTLNPWIKQSNLNHSDTIGALHLTIIVK